MPCHQEHRANRVARRDAKIRLTARRPLNEKANRIVLSQVRHGRHAVNVGEPERRDTIRRLAVDPQRFLAGRQYPNGGARTQEGVRETLGRRTDMFAVVQDEEQGLVSQVVDQRLCQRTSGLFRDVEGHRDAIGHERRIDKRGQVNKPYAIRVLLNGGSGYPEGQLGLAAATRAGNIANQDYTLPAGLDLYKFKSVVIYCRQFHVVFGRASLAEQ